MQRLLAQLALGNGAPRRYRTRSGDGDEARDDDNSGMARAVFDEDLRAVAQLLLRGVDPDAPDRCGVCICAQHAREQRPREPAGRTTRVFACLHPDALTPRGAVGSGRCCWRCCATRALTWRSCFWRRGLTQAQRTRTASPACTGWRSGATTQRC